MKKPVSNDASYPFKTVLDLDSTGTKMGRIESPQARVVEILNLMMAQGLTPMTEAETNEALKEYDHPGETIISLIGQHDYFAVKLAAEGYNLPQRISVENVTGKFQYFAVKPIKPK